MTSIPSRSAADPAGEVLDEFILVAFVMAHGAHQEVAAEKLAAFVRCLRERFTHLTENEVLGLLVRAADRFASATVSEVAQAVWTIAERLPPETLVDLHGDLRVIAKANGTIDSQERRWLDNIAHQWNVWPLRADGSPPAGGAADA